MTWGVAGLWYLVLAPVGVYLAIAFGLILSQPAPEPPVGDGLDFGSIDADDGPDPGLIQSRGGQWLRHFPGPTPGRGPLVVVVHGSGWHGAGYLALARSLALGAEVLLPDLRGHGPYPERRGDIDHIGQFEDDLAGLIVHYGGQERPVYMVGHSSGGGLVIRFAGGRHGHLLAKAALIAPFVQHDAPTARASSDWAHVLLRRVIGLSMLNAARIRFLNGLTAIQFKFPKAVLQGPLGHTATRAYSFRLNTSLAPRRNFRADIAKLPPYLVIVGSKDEAFRAEAYEPLFTAANPKGKFVLMQDVGHLDIVQNHDALAKIGQFLNAQA